MNKATVKVKAGKLAAGDVIVNSLGYRWTVTGGSRAAAAMSTGIVVFCERLTCGVTQRVRWQFDQNDEVTVVA